MVVVKVQRGCEVGHELILNTVSRREREMLLRVVPSPEIGKHQGEIE